MKNKLYGVLKDARNESDFVAVETAVAAYIAAKAEADEYVAIMDAAKGLISDVMAKTGATATAEALQIVGVQ